MTILEGDIQLLKSQVMADTDNGGGAATGVVVVDGESNDIFPDVSELDHVVGRVSLRKVFVGIHTADTSTYLGANVILSKPPGNPDISAVLFSTADDFDVRTEAASRIEAYLSIGAAYNGYLFGDHIAGQMTLLVQQRVGVALPNVGDTIDLVLNQGLSNEHSQYVRIIDVASVVQDFTDTSTGTPIDFQRNIVTLTLSDALDQDYPGFQAVYSDATVSKNGKTMLFGTVVADAARYYGIVPLTATAALGDFGVTGDGIYAQLVPSSRSEIAIPDARINQQTAALIATGSTVSLTATEVFDPAQPLFVGGGIKPGSLTLTQGSATLTDKGGTLIDVTSTVVGSVDYANGILSLSTPIFGTGAVVVNVSYTKAVNVQSVSATQGQAVTVATRRLTWTVTFDSTPAPGSLSVSYLAQGVWYVLQDDGSGALRGSDSSFGAGVLNFTTGTASITLGALPDVPSEIIYAWAAGNSVSTLPLQPVGSQVAASIAIATGFVNLEVGALTITWDGHTVTDNVSAPGTLQGYGTGTVNYLTGDVVLVPTTLPARGDTLVCTAANLATAGNGTTSTYTDGGATWTTNVGAGVLPGTFYTTMSATFPLGTADLTDVSSSAAYNVFDDNAGHLKVSVTKTNGTQVSYTVGTINYTTGDIAFSKTVVGIVMSQPHWKHGIGATYTTIFSDGMADRTVTISVVNPNTLTDTRFLYGYNVASAPGATLNFPVEAIQVVAVLSGVTSLVSVPDPTDMTGVQQTLKPGKTIFGTLAAGATFGLAGNTYAAAVGGGLLKNPAPSSGSGGAGGTWSASTGIFSVTDWNAGLAPTVTLFSASENPATSNGATLLTTSTVTFRTATSPLASAGFSIRGTMSSGTTFNVTANEDGTISTNPVYGRVDYDTGVITLVFGAVDAGPASANVIDVTDLQLPGVTYIAIASVDMNSLVYDAVAYSYIPLDPAILGLNPVRLPSDGRVPIFRKGGVAVVHYTFTTAAATHSNGDTVNLGETRLSTLNVFGSDGVEITAGFTADLDTGIVTITNVTGWAQPVTMNWRIEDAALVTDAQISGKISLSRQLSHAYPMGSYVSSAFLVGDMQASVSTLFEQQTWTNVWQDTPIGSPILAGYDDIDHPPIVTNAAAVTESWALIFTTNSAFAIVGEHLGTIGTGNTGVDCAPLNPATNTPYFTLSAVGFGTGWNAGNVIRLDTVGALTPIWLARVVQQGDNTLDEDSFTVLIRGDVDA